MGATNPLANFQTPVAPAANAFANPFITNGAPLVAAGGPVEAGGFGNFATSSIPAVTNTSSLDGLSWAAFGK